MTVYKMKDARKIANFAHRDKNCQLHEEEEIPGFDPPCKTFTLENNVWYIKNNSLFYSSYSL